MFVGLNSKLSYTYVSIYSMSGSLYSTLNGNDK